MECSTEQFKAITDQSCRKAEGELIRISISQKAVGVGRDLVFALKSPFCDIREDLVFVLVIVFSISQNLVEILSHGNLVSPKSRLVSFLYFL